MFRNDFPARAVQRLAGSSRTQKNVDRVLNLLSNRIKDDWFRSKTMQLTLKWKVWFVKFAQKPRDFRDFATERFTALNRSHKTFDREFQELSIDVKTFEIR